MTLPWMAERIQLRAIASLRPHAGNARVHEGLRAIGIDPNEGRVARDTAPQGGESAAPQQDDAVAEQPAQAAPEAPNMGSVNLREAAERLLAAWEETPPANTTQDPITRAMDMLRNALSRRGTRATGAPRKPREGTKQEVVLAMLRRPEGVALAKHSAKRPSRKTESEDAYRN